MRRNRQSRRFRSTENLPRVDETKEENDSPNPKRKLRYKLSKKFNFSDKFEDRLNRKKWLSEVFGGSFSGGQGQLLRSGSCLVRLIEEVSTLGPRGLCCKLKQKQSSSWQSHEKSNRGIYWVLLGFSPKQKPGAR